jgi:hypothetical protein
LSHDSTAHCQTERVKRPAKESREL